MSQTALLPVGDPMRSWTGAAERAERQRFKVAPKPTPCRSTSDSSGCFPASYAGRNKRRSGGGEEVASLPPLKIPRESPEDEGAANVQKCEEDPFGASRLKALSCCAIALPESPVSSQTNVQSPGGSCSSSSSLDKQLTREILHAGMDQTRPLATSPSNFHFENSAGRHQGHTIWEGCVKHRVSAGKTIELFGLVLPVPRDLIESFPPTLFVSELIPVDQVTRAQGDAEAHCSFQGVSDEHCRTILKLAETKLCLAVRLQDCDLWLSPVRLGNGKLGSRCVFRRTM